MRKSKILMLFFIVLLFQCDDSIGFNKKRLYIKTKYYIVKEEKVIKYLFGKKVQVSQNRLNIYNPDEFFELNKEQRKLILDGISDNIESANKRRR